MRQGGHRPGAAIAAISITIATAAAVAACTPTPAPTPTATATPPPSSAAPAALTITGSGKVCPGPWWMGCGAYLVIEPPGWSLPDDWEPGTDDTSFAIRLKGGVDGPYRVTGVIDPGREQIEPGEHRLVVIEAHMSDSPPSPREDALETSAICSADLAVSPGTTAVRIDVEFGKRGVPCTIAVRLDPPSAAPA